MSTEGRLGFLRASGAHHDIGVQLGRFGAETVHRHLVRTHAWASVMARRGDDQVAGMRAIVSARFPAVWQELTGLALGLVLPFDDVFLWNCRGDLWALSPDGCTTVQIPGDVPIVAHNEDGDPGFRGHCAIVHVTPEEGRAFAAFIYPASIPGHTFAVTETGLVQAVNNIRSREAGIGVPRMVLGRAVLDCATLDEAVYLLQSSDRAGAFHFTLAQRGDRRLVSLEFTHGRCSGLVLERAACHANHLVHAQMIVERQVITASSRSRQRRADFLIGQAGTGRLEPQTILWDKADAALPVYRAQVDDPDQENTLATAILGVGVSSIDWQVFDCPGGSPRFRFSGLEKQDE